MWMPVSHNLLIGGARAKTQRVCGLPESFLSLNFKRTCQFLKIFDTDASMEFHCNHHNLRQSWIALDHFGSIFEREWRQKLKHMITGLSRCALCNSDLLCQCWCRWCLESTRGLVRGPPWNSKWHQAEYKHNLYHKETKSWTKRSLGPSSKMSRWHNLAQLAKSCCLRISLCRLQIWSKWNRSSEFQQVVAKMEDLGVTLPLQELEKAGAWALWCSKCILFFFSFEACASHDIWCFSTLPLVFFF